MGPPAVLARVDARVLLAVYGGAHGRWGWAMIALTVLGSGWAALALVPMLCHGRTRRFAGVLAAAIAVQATAVWALKLAFGRVRPWIALGLPPPLGTPSDFSFPSGHAAGSFCVAAFLALALPAAWPGAPRRARVAGLIAVALAALVALSRVYLGAHFPSDVVAGALLGSLVGATAAGLYVRGRASVR